MKVKLLTTILGLQARNNLKMHSNIDNLKYQYKEEIDELQSQRVLEEFNF